MTLKNKINVFMTIFMYELEVKLSNSREKLKKITYQLDEANTDRYLKECIKEIIEKNKNTLVKNTCIKSFRDTEFSELPIHQINCIKNHISLIKVLLPENINTSVMSKLNHLNKKNTVLPDIVLELMIDNNIHYEPIELKSTKTDSIPGSSIQQINPDEWVIFIKHTKNSLEITTGRYINSINSKIQFPDRSLRPQVSFKELLNWNINHRQVKDNMFIIKQDNNIDEKLVLLNDWQNVLCQRWMEMLLHSDNIKENEPWFNNTLRKFMCQFLDEYNNLTENNKSKLYQTILSQIQN
ncbi:hypothetical protein AN396_10095 [Candidatus Epulonipiscium fishelsonii]|uniref:Uncharacterized protein n=1 Tax=Candidatus Epulonipiscium fishelsonii TaxID=77094 RepID=A0ACC8X9N2_9FIRM|nr:hypothetical protein AN396_10095 [Epulopiscium sp. SCG-B11WGA-EpuloA1]